MSMMRISPKIVLNGVDVVAGQSGTSGWFRVPRGDAFNWWFQQVSAESVSSTIYIDYSIFDDESLATFNGTANYLTATLKSAETTHGAAFSATGWQQYNTPAALNSPFCIMRVRVAVTVADATLYFAFASNIE
jgi:hypothetical protein